MRLTMIEMDHLLLQFLLLPDEDLSVEYGIWVAMLTHHDSCGGRCLE